MKIISVCFSLIVIGFGGGASASMMTSDTTQVGSPLSDIVGRTDPAQIGSGDDLYHNKKSHFDRHGMNHYSDNNSWFGNSGNAFDHSFLERDNNHSWGSHGHGDRCETIPPVAAVPIPAATWLFGPALMVLVGLISRNRFISVSRITFEKPKNLKGPFAPFSSAIEVGISQLNCRVVRKIWEKSNLE